MIRSCPELFAPPANQLSVAYKCFGNSRALKIRLSKPYNDICVLTHLSAIETQRQPNQNPHGVFSLLLGIVLDQRVCQVGGRRVRIEIQTQSSNSEASV